MMQLHSHTEGLLFSELGIGALYAALGMVLLSWMERDSRRRATLERMRGPAVALGRPPDVRSAPKVVNDSVTRGPDGRFARRKRAFETNAEHLRMPAETFP